MNRKEDYQRYCDERMAQKIRENNQILRTIESKIRAIYVSKGQSLQLAEMEKKRLQEKLDMKDEMERLRALEAEYHEHERNRKLEIRKRQAKQRIDLQDQMADKQAKRKLLYEEFLKEKIVIDEILAQIQQEQIEEMQSKLRQSERFKNDLQRLIEEQDMWKREQERITAEENARIVQYIEERERNVAIQREAEQQKMTIMLEQQEKMVSVLNDIEREKLEHEELLIELKAHELEEKQISLDRKQIEEDIRRRLNAKLALEEQMRDIELRQAQRAFEEEAFRVEQQKLLVERDRIESLTRDAQRIKKLEHQQKMRELLEKRELTRKAQIMQLIEEQNELMAMEKRRQEIFARERRKILQQHADDIIGFLPRELIESDM